MRGLVPRIHAAPPFNARAIGAPWRAGTRPAMTK
jgi:hypothetical protein